MAKEAAETRKSDAARPWLARHVCSPFKSQPDCFFVPVVCAFFSTDHRRAISRHKVIAERRNDDKYLRDAGSIGEREIRRILRRFTLLRLTNADAAGKSQAIFADSYLVIARPRSV